MGEQIFIFMWITLVSLFVYLLMGLMISQLMPKNIRDCNDLCNTCILLWPIVLPVRIVVIVSKFVISLLTSLKEVYINIFKD